MTTWLITGASGFLGVNLGLHVRRQSRVLGVSRSKPLSGIFDATATLDLLREDETTQVIRKLAPDVIVNVAAIASHAECERNPEMAHRVNVDVPRTLALIASSIGARFIHISTDAVFEGGRGDYRETDLPGPFSVYGRSKLLGEQAVLHSYSQALVARTNFFGWSPSGSQSILEFFVNSLRAGDTVPGYTDFIVTSLYAQHLADLLVRLAATDATGIVHVASIDSLSKYDFACLIADNFGLNRRLIAPTSNAHAHDGIGRRRNLSLNTERLTELLDHAPPSQVDGILDAVADEHRIFKGPLRKV